MITPPTVRMANDYNRTLPMPIRWAHVGAAAVREYAGPMLMWWAAPVRRKWTMPLTLAVALFWALHPWDLWLYQHMAAVQAGLPSDVRREWFAWQQYGQTLSLVVVACLVGLLDPTRWRRLLDLGAGAIVAGLIYNLMKMGIARPRPNADVPGAAIFPGPWGMYPLRLTDASGQVHETLVSGWNGYSQVWSMPSSHAVAAVLLSVFLTRMYPRLKWPMMLLAAVPVTGRVLFGAHWATDVAVGACLGYAIGACAADGYWGVRALDWIWGNVFGHSRERPSGMWPEVAADEQRRRRAAVL